MSLEEKVYSVLVVSAAESFNASIKPLFPEFRFSPVQWESSVNAARRLLAERSFDLVLINSPLPDDPGFRFAIDLAGEKGTVVLLFVREDSYEAVWSRAAEYGVFTLAKPTSRQTVAQALDWMIAAVERMRLLEKKAVTLEERMQEIRQVNRAKWLLIDRCQMTEAEAHRYIEKRAMDECVTKAEIAEGIIRTYG